LRQWSRRQGRKCSAKEAAEPEAVQRGTVEAAAAAEATANAERCDAAALLEAEAVWFRVDGA